MTSWLALTLQLEAAAADPFSDALLEAGAQSVTIEPRPDGRQSVVALLAAGTSPFALLEQAARAAGIPTPSATTHAVAERDWVSESQAQFAPYAIGRRLWVGPTWLTPPAADAIVRLDPGLAFGTGSHPSTRLALQFLAQQPLAGMRVLDYGCGSGILAIAAAKLGAAQVHAVDVDPDALECTRANARANDVTVLASSPEALEPLRYEVVVSNILAQPLIVLAPLLASRTAPGGHVALSGILVVQAPEVSAAYAPYFAMRAERQEEGWVLLEGARR